MRMSLGWKAAALILLNVVLTFSAGLLARNFVLNPELAKIERLNDEKILHQLGFIEGFLKNSIAESARLLKTIAAHDTDKRWETIAPALAELAASSELSYVIVASLDGGVLKLLPGAYFNSNQAPSPDALNNILASVKDQISERQAFVNLLNSEQGPLLIAGDYSQSSQAEHKNDALVFIAINKIDEAFIQRINQLTGVALQLIGMDEFEALRNEPRALSGLRSDGNKLHWSFNAADGTAAITAAIELPPRSYDDKILTPTLVIAMVITLATWCIAIWLLHRTIIRPMNNASTTLQKIMQDKDYARQLEYKHHDEFGRLVVFCNRLLGMVDQHTTELQALSLTDPLTELGNRRAFDTQSQKFWALAERNNTRMALIAFDIDYFKSYNDRFGHPAGDKVIAGFAKILEQSFKRASDVVARVGGEEFLVITQDTPAGACLVLANRVLQELREMRFEHPENPATCVTASAGVFQGTPDANLSLEIALTRVDEILYTAKQEGRNRAMYSETLRNAVKEVKSAEVHKLPRKK